MEKIHILQIEDDAVNAQLIQYVLEKEWSECIVQTVGNASEGLEIAGKEKPDLIILDWSLPDMLGTEALKCIQMDDELKHIPVILFVYDPFGPINSLFDPVVRFMKPVNLKLFVECVREVLETES